MSHETNVESLKELGNVAVRNQKYHEAILHYTHAIKLDPRNYVLYSNRSFSFLKVQQYYLAMEDANETINLNPTWPKGYFRKGEVEFAAYHFLDAYNSYQKACELLPDDNNIIEAVAKARQEHEKDLRADLQIPWLGAGVGIVLGVLIVIADFLYTSKPTLTHPILMVILTISVAMLGYGVARAFRYYVKCQRNALLQEPIDLISKEDGQPSEQIQNDSKLTGSSNRYTKSQARQRYKKGKL